MLTYISFVTCQFFVNELNEWLIFQRPPVIYISRGEYEVQNIAFRIANLYITLSRDFEMDTIAGKNYQDSILAITGRKTNLLLIAKLEYGKNSTELAKTTVKLLKSYKKDIKTITTNNGPEFAIHSHITNELGVVVYFAGPYVS